MTLTTTAPAVAPRSPAEVYEAEFVPALFRPFAATVLDAAAVSHGQQVLDVACGTGVLALRELQRAGKRPVSARDFANAVNLAGLRFGP